MEPMLGLFIVAGMFVWAFWLVWSARGADADAVSRLVNGPLPPLTVAYRQIMHVLALVGVSGGSAVVFTAIALATFNPPEPALAIALPLALLAAAVFLRSLPQVARDTRWSPLKRPVLSMSEDGVTLTGRWSVRWTEVEAIRFVSINYGRWPRPYMLLSVSGRDRFPKNSWIDERSIRAVVQESVDDTLMVEIGSTTLPDWTYEVLAKRYWCAAHERPYVPARPGFPISGDVSLRDVRGD